MGQDRVNDHTGLRANIPLSWVNAVLMYQGPSGAGGLKVVWTIIGSVEALQNKTANAIVFFVIRCPSGHVIYDLRGLNSAIFGPNRRSELCLRRC